MSGLAGIRIDPLTGDDDEIARLAALLRAGFRELAPHAWPDDASAREEVIESLAPERISLVARDDGGRIVGWISAQPQYAGHSWELHPLVVDPERQRRGIGRMLVAELERRVRERGASTIFLGTDDEHEGTSIGGVELFPGVLDRIRDIRDLRGHPIEFYRRVGYEVVGVIPDANGRGKPDIFMAKSLRDPSAR